MNVLDTKFERLIRGKLAAAIAKKADDVVSGVPTFDKYREDIGYIRALKDALVMVDKARAELVQDK